MALTRENSSQSITTSKPARRMVRIARSVSATKPPSDLSLMVMTFSRGITSSKSSTSRFLANIRICREASG